MKDNSEQYKKELIDVFLAISKDKQIFSSLMKDILTPRELDNVSVRWQIVKRLAKGEHQHAIAEDLHLGVATITRGSREMRKKEGGFNKALKFLKIT